MYHLMHIAIIKPIGMSKRFLDSLPCILKRFLWVQIADFFFLMARKKRKRVEKEKCAICLDDKEISDMAKLDGCCHVYCVECIEKWVKRESSCPQCKSQIKFLTVPGRARRKRIKHAEQAVEEEETNTEDLIGYAVMNYVASPTFRRHLAQSLIFNPNRHVYMLWNIIMRALPALQRQISRDIIDGEAPTELTFDVLNAVEAMQRLRRVTPRHFSNL